MANNGCPAYRPTSRCVVPLCLRITYFLPSILSDDSSLTLLQHNHDPWSQYSLPQDTYPYIISSLPNGLPQRLRRHLHSNRQTLVLVPAFKHYSSLYNHAPITFCNIPHASNAHDPIRFCNFPHDPDADELCNIPHASSANEREHPYTPMLHAYGASDENVPGRLVPVRASRLPLSKYDYGATRVY